MPLKTSILECLSTYTSVKSRLMNNIQPVPNGFRLLWSLRAVNTPSDVKQIGSGNQFGVMEDRTVLRILTGPRRWLPR